MVDAPEWNQGTLGPRARAALSSMIPVGMRVELETDAEPVGPYGRLLAYVYLPGGRMVNEELLRQGMALLAVIHAQYPLLDTVSKDSRGGSRPA